MTGSRWERGHRALSAESYIELGNFGGKADFWMTYSARLFTLLGTPHPHPALQSESKPIESSTCLASTTSHWSFGSRRSLRMRT